MRLLEKVTVSRRRFLASAAGFAVALKSLPVWATDKIKKVAFGLDKAEKLKQVGGTVSLKLLGRNVLFVRDAEKTVRAVDPVCTHNKCNVAYKADEQLLRCPCHGSTYSLDGQVRNGPAVRPLAVFPAELEGDRVIVSLPVEKP